MFQPLEQPCCPRCGGILLVPLGIAYHAAEGELVSSNYSIKFTKHEGLIFELLWKNRSRRLVTIQMMHEFMYGSDPNGGPDEKIIQVYICKMRKKLWAAQADIDIVTEHERGYGLKTNAPARRPRAVVAA